MYSLGECSNELTGNSAFGSSPSPPLFSSRNLDTSVAAVSALRALSDRSGEPAFPALMKIVST
jgi:hypothetical protein